MNGLPKLPLTPAKAGVRWAKWIAAFAGMSGVMIWLSPALAQQTENPIPDSGGALIMPKAQLPDPLAAGWKGRNVCAVLEENQKLRALKCSFAPGEGHERHFHAAHFGYVVEGGKMRVTDKSGTREIETKAGDTWTSDGIDWHEALNIGKTKTIYIIVEPKGTLK